MTRKTARTNGQVSAARVTRLERTLASCADRIDSLERENQIQLKRMAAMQAEVDDLRSRVRPI